MAAFAKRNDERGASAVEYGLLITGLATVIAAAVLLFGGTVLELFTDTCDQMDAQESVSASCPD